MAEETIRAVYSPKNTGKLSSKMLEYSGREFSFKFVYEINGERYYEPCDKNFSESRPVPEEDLKITK